jgi:hypothetical protein
MSSSRSCGRWGRWTSTTSRGAVSPAPSRARPPMNEQRLMPRPWPSTV